MLDEPEVLYNAVVVFVLTRAWTTDHTDELSLEKLCCLTSTEASRPIRDGHTLRTVQVFIHETLRTVLVMSQWTRTATSRYSGSTEAGVGSLVITDESDSPALRPP